MKHIIAYSPPYGENYLKELEVFSFMHSCGINGVKLILSNSFSALGIPYSPYPLIWRGPGDYDFSIVDRQISDIVERNPDVRFIAMIDLNSPPWIKEKMKRDSFNELGECFLDPLWLSAVEEYQEKLVAHLETHHADRVFAYYIACGKTQEWFDHRWCMPTPRRVAHYKEWCESNGRTPLAIPQENEHQQCLGEFLPDHLIQWKEYGNYLTCKCATHFSNGSGNRSGLKSGSAAFSEISTTWAPTDTLKQKSSAVKPEATFTSDLPATARSPWGAAADSRVPI